MKGWQIACMMLSALFLGRASVYLIDLHNRPMPILIGHGCAGAGGDIWAMDESDFPTRCAQIERY